MEWISHTRSTSVKKTLFLLLALAALQASSEAEEGQALFAKLTAKYADCKSFSCEGHNDVVSTFGGKDHPYHSEERFSIRFQRPALIRVDWQSPNPSTFTPITSSLYTEDGKYWGIPSFRRTPEAFRDLDSGLGAFAGISGGATYTIPNFLLGRKGYFHSITCKLLADAQVDGHDCYTLEVTEKISGVWTLSIDRADYALRKSRQVHEITEEQALKDREDMAQHFKDKNLPMPTFPATAHTITTVVDYTKIVFDEEMAPEQFVFKDAKAN